MIEILSAPAQNLPPDVKRYSTREFAEATGLSVRTIEDLRSKRKKGRLMPAGYDEKGRAYYTADQIDVAKQFCRPTKKLPPVANVVPLFDNPTNETVAANGYREDDGSNDDPDDVEENIAVVLPTDPPPKTAEAARVGVLAAVDRENDSAAINLPMTIETSRKTPDVLKFGQLPKENFDAEYLRLIKHDISQARAHLEELPESQRRGLTLDTYRHFSCGYLHDWILTKSRAEYTCGLYTDKNGKAKHLPPPSPRIIIPTPSLNHFNAVATPAARANMNKEFWKQHAGSKSELFGDDDALNDDLIVIVEGEADAMSIWQCSVGKIAVVAIMGCANWKKTLLPKLPDLRGKKFLLLFDADDGKDKAKELCTELLKRGYLAVMKFIYDALPTDEQNFFGIKADANRILEVRGDEYLNSLLEKIIADATPDFNDVAAQIQQQNLFVQEQSQPTAPEKSCDVAEFENVDRDEIKLILKDFVHAKNITRDDWAKVGMILYRYGFTLEDWQEWSKDDSRYCASACEYQWKSFKTATELKGEGYTVATLIQIAKQFGYKPSRKAVTFDSKTIPPESNPRHEENKDNQIDALKTELRAVNKSIADFDTEKDAAIVKLRNVETFDSETVFSEEIMTAAAFARFADRQAFSDFRREVKNYGDKNKDKKVSINDWLADVKDRAAEIATRQADLIARRNEIQAEINSLSFVGSHDVLKDFSIPEGYSISETSGIVKVDGEKFITVCRRPVIISGKSFDVEEKNFKLSLTYLTNAGVWKTLPSVEADIPADSRKIVSLAKKGLPVTSVNALQLVDYLDAFNALNENTLPLTYFVNRCGWYHFNDTDYFIDPRRNCVIQDDDKNISVKVDEGRSEFAKHLKPVGSIEAWKKVYKLAKKYPVARLIVTASVAPILLKVLGERNFLLYIYAPTRAGKTTALLLGASAIGDEKIIRSFDATKNGLAGAAADVNDYAFLIDEKQVADNRLKEAFDNLIYALANGIGRTKLNKDSTLKKTQDWRTIAIMTGETEMLSDNVTGGAYTRLLTIKAPAEILPADVCKIIRDTIKNNCGLVLPLVVDKVKELGEEYLRGVFKEMVDTFEERFSEILPEYRRYMAILTLADTILNAVTFGNTITTDDGRTIKASDDAIINAAKIFPLIPTVAEISDTARGKEFVRGLVAQNQNRFIGGNVPLERMQAIWGTIEDRVYIYITARALKDACKNEGYDYRKLVADLVTDKFIIPSTKIKRGCKKPLDTVQRKIGKTNADCYRIPRSIFESVADNEE